ncbi:MAG: ABC transporter ATP-binding protein [Christensenellaceae bacterium]|jgi:branched-chain amino acid transport system ATP-binding protein|nr:ABC transporter ATP-binding protein [Christensenellaceae bacterium]
MLKIKNLHAYYGAIEGLKGVDIDVEDGKITCIIGSNGAGKTTLLKAISGVVKRFGSMLLDDMEIGSFTPRQVARAGITHVPESRHIFPGLTVEKNLETGTFPWHGFFSNASFTKELDEVYELFPRLKERRNQLGWSLSGGEQQMLAIGRGIMARPKILMLDEPSMGLAPMLIDELFEKIVEINARGISILLVEQNAHIALEVSHNAYVMESGKIALQGPSISLQHDDRVTKAYFGSLYKKK